MTTPSRDDLALYAMGHHDGDPAAIEQLLADDPDARAQLAAEAELELVLREAASLATFCAVCHDLVRGDRCAACGVAVRSGDTVAAAPAHARGTITDVVVEPAHARGATAVAIPPPEPLRPTRRLRAPLGFAAVTLAGAAVVGAVVLRAEVLVTAAPAIAPPLPAEPVAVAVDLRLGAQLPAVAPAPPAPPRPAPTRPAPQPLQPTPAPPTQPAPARPAPAQPASTTVELRIVTQPAGVVVFLDHQELGLTPLVVRVPRRPSAEISLEHIGYQEHVHKLALTSDTKLAVTLTSRGGPPVHEGKFTDAQCMQCHKPQGRRASLGPAPTLIRGPGAPLDSTTR